MDVLISVLQFIGVIIMCIGIALVEDTGVQLILAGAFLVSLMVVIEARRSA